MSMRVPRIVTAILLLWSASAVLAVDITACGTTIGPRETGVLQTDLDCSTSGFAVRLLRNATLDLNGHALHGGDSTTATVVGVGRDDTTDVTAAGRGVFTIVGPGEISGTTHPPLLTGTRACVLLNGGRASITSPSGIVDIHHCNYGVLGSHVERPDQGRATLYNVAVHDAVESGVSVRSLVASHVDAYANHGIGMGASGRMSITDVTASDNGIGFFAGKAMRGANVTVTDNHLNGVDSCGFGTVVLTNLVATGNAFAGACADRLRLIDSTVTGNNSTDVYSIRFPILINTTCGSSAGVNSTSTPWGVCAND
jgi:hypothetical protein